jgi:Na+/proline symporter
MLGVPGAWILLIMLFMAIVSTGCAEIIAVATIMTYDVYCEYLNPELKTERMNNRQIFYATMIGKSSDLGVSRARAPANVLSVEELEAKSIETIELTKVSECLKKLEKAHLLPSGRDFEDTEAKAIESALLGYLENDNLVTYENFYFALQSQVLSKLSYEASIVLRMMKFFCICFAVFMGFLANFLQSILAPYGRGLGFVYCSMGIFVGPAVAPAAMAILMETANAKWCTIGAISGLIGGITVWIATAYYMFEGEVTVATLDGDYPFLNSNVTSILLSAFVAIAGSIADPDTKFKWKLLTVQLPLVDDMPPLREDGRTAKELDDFLIKSYKKSCASALFLFVFLCGLFPGALYASSAIFGKTGFSVWIGVFMLWCFIGGMVVIILPILDFKKDLKNANELKKVKAAKEAEKDKAAALQT